MRDWFRNATKGRYCLPSGEDVHCLADVSAADCIELHRLTIGVNVRYTRAEIHTSLLRCGEIRSQARDLICAGKTGGQDVDLGHRDLRQRAR